MRPAIVFLHFYPRDRLFARTDEKTLNRNLNSGFKYISPIHVTFYVRIRLASCTLVWQHDHSFFCHICPLLFIKKNWYKDWELENNTNLNSIFCFIKSSEIVFIFLPVFYLIIWLIASPKNFEKIAILKIWQLVFFWGVKIYLGKLFCS